MASVALGSCLAVEIRGDTLTPAKLRHALLAAKALQYDSDLLLRRKAAPGLSSYVADGCFRGWLLLTWHVTLLGGKTSVNVS